ncbi:ABC transporter ATP-binding protein [Pelagibacteraceae bacterium]|jgi:ABC-2 type transport system ATP-binding protein|nr:ABC transporter ATP-binding protein [Pelagibacteraceae bacterium]|tara:strand:- start:1549 stop:2481 length:933 start_codon:yes stop_codon:yes gene_type:complete
MTDKLISIQNLSKTYNDSFQALKNVSLDINKGEIFALLGPNGAGKTTLINIICGLVRPSSGSVMVNGADIIKDYKITRSQIGLVPQELTLEQFETVFQNVSYTRGLYGKSGNPTYIEKVLRDLSLWDKKKTRLGQLSGGMKRRVLIAKALSHEPSVLFLDEPTAGVDVELRQDMWRIVENLRQTGVTIILTTHYIEEAEAIADRVGVIDNGEMIVVDEKDALISKMGQKKLIIQLHEKVTNLPEELSSYELELAADGLSLSYSYDAKSSQTGITNLLQKIKDSGMKLSDLKTEQGTLEDIFVSLVNKEKK